MLSYLAHYDIANRNALGRRLATTAQDHSNVTSEDWIARKATDAGERYKKEYRYDTIRRRRRVSQETPQPIREVHWLGHARAESGGEWILRELYDRGRELGRGNVADRLPIGDQLPGLLEQSMNAIAGKRCAVADEAEQRRPARVVMAGVRSSDILPLNA